jgi:hypothetical protein
MKTLLRTGKYAVAVLAILACAVTFSWAKPKAAGETAGKVVITKTGIRMHPCVPVSEEDDQAMDKVLNKYSKSLYKIDTVQAGKVTKTRGQAKLNAALAAETKKKMPKGCTILDIVLVNPDALTPISKNDYKLIEDLKPILQKYQ